MASIFKIVNKEEWARQCANGAFVGAGIDVTDGFIHFSFAEQVAGTLERFFPRRGDLLLVEVKRSADIESKLKIENGDDFYVT
jgi:uncharacterized protein (DUF952 family)